VRAAALTPLTLPERSEPAAEPAESMPAPAPPVVADRLAAVRAGLAKASGVEVLDGERLVLGSALLFPPGQAELSPEGRQGLRAIADRLKTALSTLPPGTAWTLHIDGHTDDTPVRHSRFASNQALSEARARAVTDYLASRGLPPDRLVAAGLADRQPLAAGRSEEARGRNRRIELRLTTP
jgi:chemotaxis protein MotB